MSFPFGNRSSFRDRAMGKSGDEILDDMLKNIKQRKKEFFESPPKWRSMGVFDDEVGSAGGSRFKDHLGDLAARHPELADHLLDLLPNESKTGAFPKAKGKAEETKNSSQNYRPKEANRPQTTTTGTQTGGLESDIKLRSTVPDMQSSAGESLDSERGQRAQSAPPQAPLPNRPQQKEEGVRHIPIRTDSPSGMPRSANQNFSKPSAPFSQTHQQFYHQPQQHYQQPQPQHFPEQGRQEEGGGKGPTVRHIPIFVEGRDEPLLPRDVGPGVGSKRGGCQGKPEQPAPEKKQAPPPEQQNHDQGGQQQQTQQQQASQQQAQPPPTPAPSQKPDPLSQVAEVVKEVEALAVKVNEWSGRSRTDKDYMYLDEMLTRNLLKLDNIETEGKDEVRTARKEAIRKIQAAISVLESKTENTQVQQNNEEVREKEAISIEDKNTPEESMQTQPSESQETSSTHCATQT